jgi:hypothetical protein
MSDFNDIARRNPKGAEMVITSFGYEIIDRRDLGRSLNELVASEGERALRKVMEVHPDKDLILELFSSNKKEQKSCSCGSCMNKNMSGMEYFNASGLQATQATQASQNASSNTLAHQTNAILVVSALFIATALILKNK